MRHITLIAPRVTSTLDVLRAFTAMDEVLSVISLDPHDVLPADVRSRVASHQQVRSVLAADALLTAVQAIQRRVGRVDRLVGPFEVQQLPIAHVRDALGIEGIGQEVARNFRDKDRMKEVLRANGIPVARSMLARSSRAVRAFVDDVGLPIVVKPRAGVGAQATFRLTSASDLDMLAARGLRPSPSSPLQLEELVVAHERTCESVTIRGAVVWRSGTRYLPSPLEVLEAPWQQYCVVLPREENDAELSRFSPLADRALRALFGSAADTAAGTALTHMEWFAGPAGFFVNEVGARPPGAQIMPLLGIAHETNFWRDWAELVARDRFTPKPRRWATGVAFFRGQGRGDRVTAVEGLEAAVEAVGDELVDLCVPCRGQPRSPSYEGDGWAIVRSSTTQGVKQALLALIRRVRVRYG